jgi:phosphoadenosine phosphosulfate reductase
VAARPRQGEDDVTDCTTLGGLTTELAEEIETVNAQLESAPPGEIIRWARDRFGRDLVIAASFQDLVLVDLAVAGDPGIEVIFLDTGAHFPETLRFVADAQERYRLNLTVTRPGPEADAYPCGSARCCEFRKVAPLREALVGRQAWLTGLKRVDAPTRSDAPVVGWDEPFGVVKVNPLATWTEDDVDAYLHEHQLPIHPLVTRGYLSIGCAPTTRPVAEGEDPRAGRWAGTDKVECGLHL